MKRKLAKFHINQEITLEGEIYKVIGIDDYTMQNVLDRQVTWTSFTLLDKKGKRGWVSTHPLKDCFIKWELVSAKEFQSYATGPVNLEISGIISLAFQGDFGVSTPNAEIIWFDLTNSDKDLVLVERFLEVKGDDVKPLECYYNAGKIVEVTI